MQAVLLLNNNLSYLTMISWKRAINLVLKNKAEVVKYTEKVITNSEKTVSLKIPKVIKLVYFIAKVSKAKMIYSKKVVFLRDNHSCVYCGSNNKLTIDHLVPKMRGGKSTFDNTVTACFSCNNRKGNQTPEEAGLKLHKRPYTPSITDYMRLKFKDIDLGEIYY